MADLFCKFYDVTETPAILKARIFCTRRNRLEAFASACGRDPEQLKQEFATVARQQLLAVRDQRIRPGLDDKVLADWNGLMIDTLARAGAVLQIPEYLEAAHRASDDGLYENA